MGDFRLRVSRDILRLLRSLDDETGTALIDAINGLASNFLPEGVEQAIDGTGIYSIVVADYYIAYSVSQAERLVRILRVAKAR
jgi:mRNA-degrading endonuclease RelE of RelBE toxin-antitoxin system